MKKIKNKKIDESKKARCSKAFQRQELKLKPQGMEYGFDPKFNFDLSNMRFAKMQALV